MNICCFTDNCVGKRVGVRIWFLQCSYVLLWWCEAFSLDLLSFGVVPFEQTQRRRLLPHAVQHHYTLPAAQGEFNMEQVTNWVYYAPPFEDCTEMHCTSRMDSSCFWTLCQGHISQCEALHKAQTFYQKELRSRWYLWPEKLHIIEMMHHLKRVGNKQHCPL